MVTQLTNINGKEDGAEGSKMRPVACVDNTGEFIVIHRGKFMFTVYQIKGNEATKKDVIDLQKEIRACGNPGFTFEAYDTISEIRFLAQENTHIRVCYTKGTDHFFIDVQLYDCVPAMRKAMKYEDKSVFQLTVAAQANTKQL